MSETILVTGGAGFLGRHLCRGLARGGYGVRVLDLKVNPEFETIIGDVRDKATSQKALDGVGAVFHLASSIEAGESVKQPAAYMDNNVMGTITLLEAMREMGIKTFIFSSSAAVYGEPIRTPIFEDDRTMPINPYGVTKLAMEGLASSYAANFGFSCTALRYFNLYGPGERHEPETHVIPRFVHQIHNGEAVTVWGSGEHQRDFVYVEDIVKAHILALTKSKEASFSYMNLSGKNAIKVIDLIGMIAKIIGKEANIQHFDPRPGDPLLLFADGSKAKEVLDWESMTPIETGLEATIKDLLAA